MPTELRKLNAEGVRRFSEYLRSGAMGPAPQHYLVDPTTSQPFLGGAMPDRASFQSRYEFGRYLEHQFRQMEVSTFSRDQGFWTGLALYWFDDICPLVAGQRNPDKEYRYILSADYRHYYRHAVRSPWQLVRDHGALAKLLLVSPKEPAHPLSVHGEILEQLGGRQQILRSRPIMTVADKLYFDKESGRPRKGVAGSGRGSARRFGLVLRQLDLTYDPESMKENALIDILPREFDRWRGPKQVPDDVRKSAAVQGQAGMPG